MDIFSKNVSSTYKPFVLAIYLFLLVFFLCSLFIRVERSERHNLTTIMPDCACRNRPTPTQPSTLRASFVKADQKGSTRRSQMGASPYCLQMCAWSSTSYPANLASRAWNPPSFAGSLLQYTSMKVRGHGDEMRRVSRQSGLRGGAEMWPVCTGRETATVSGTV